MGRSPAITETAPGLPAWMRWGGAALTALLAVLFVVLLAQVRQQGQRLQTLQDRVQALENARDLERTNALEDQLRSTVQRLQTLEGLEQSLQQLSLEQANLRQQIRSQAGGGASLEPLLPGEPLSPPAGGNRNRPARPAAPPPLPEAQP